MAKIDVFTIWHNRAPAVFSSLHSLLDQTLSDFRLIAVDDGSTDATFSRLKEMQSVATGRGVEMEVVKKINTGFTPSLVWAIETYSDSEFIAIHGAGDISLPRRLKEQLSEASRWDAALVGCWVEVVNQEGVVVGTRTVPGEISHDLRKNRIGRPGTHGAAFMRRDAYVASGGYRSEFKYAQDADLWIRIADRGKMVNVQEVLYQKIRFGNSVSASQYKKILQRMYSSTAIQIALSPPRQSLALHKKLQSQPIIRVFPIFRFIRRSMPQGVKKFPTVLAVSKRLNYLLFTAGRHLRLGALTRLRRNR